MSTQDTKLPPLPASPIAGEFASWCRSKGSTAKACDDANTWIRDAFNAGAAIAAQAPQASPTCVWIVESKTFSVLCATKAEAEKYMASLPITVSGGMSISAVPVIGAQQAQGVPPLLAALKEKIDEAIKVSDDVGRSRGSNCYAQNTRAVVKICELQDSIARDLDALAAHDKEAAIRLRGICDDLGLVSAVPKTDEQLMESQFAVFGMIRRALARAAIAAQAPQADACGDSCAAFEAAFMSENGFHTKAELAVEWDKGLSGVMFRAGIQLAQQAQGVPSATEQLIHHPYTPRKAEFEGFFLSMCERPLSIHEIARRCWKKAAAPQAEPVSDADAQELRQWRAMSDPAVLYANLLRGLPAKLTAGQLQHLMGAAEPQPEREPTTWSRYVAGMIACYLKWPDGDERTEAVAGIIERRRWSDRQPEREPLSDAQIEALPFWSHFVGLFPATRQEITRAIEAAHGIGTKGGSK